MYFETECEMAVHPRSLILALIERAYATSYWSSVVTLVLSYPWSYLAPFQRYYRFSAEKSDPTLFQIFGVFPLD